MYQEIQQKIMLVMKKYIIKDKLVYSYMYNITLLSSTLTFGMIQFNVVILK